jgi:transposase
MARRTPVAVVRCGDCGAGFELSTRNASRYRAEGTQPRCQDCRRAPVMLSERQRRRLESWWRQRFGENELQEMAQALREGW